MSEPRTNADKVILFLYVAQHGMTIFDGPDDQQRIFAMLTGLSAAETAQAFADAVARGHLEQAAPAPDQSALEQLVAAARIAGAEGIWIVRGARVAALRWASDEDEARRGVWPQIQLEPPHELIILIRFPVGDGDEAGVEFRQ